MTINTHKCYALTIILQTLLKSYTFSILANICQQQKEL